MTASHHWHLGVLNPGKSFETVEQLTEAEFDEIAAAAASLQRLTYDFTWSLLCKNYSQFRDILSYHQTLYGLKHTVRSRDGHYEDSLYSSIINWLTSVHLHLDHAEAEVSRRFGKDSEQARELRSVTSEQYDGRLGYRFCYRLRNYYLHAGVPAFREQRSIPTPDDPAWMKQRFRLLLNRDEVVSRWDGWSTVADDIRALDEAFEFAPLVDEAMDGLARVHTNLVKIRIENAIDLIEVIESAADKIEASGKQGQPLLFRITYNDDGEATELQPQELFIAHAAALRTAVDRVDRIEELIRVRTPEDRSDSWSRGLESGALNTSSVGCRLLVEWFERGRSDDPAFIATVRSELAQSNGLNLVIDGLVMTAGTLAHMTASLLGTEPRLLLHDLGLIPKDAAAGDPGA